MNQNDLGKGVIIILGIIVILLILTSGVLKGRADKPVEYIEITVKQGDTLWAYWQQYGQAERYDKWLYEVRQLNNLGSAGIYEGQKLKILVREGE